MGTVKSIDFKIGTGNMCKGCGMKKMTGCCHDDLRIIKLTLDQQLTKLDTWFFDGIAGGLPHRFSLALAGQSAEKFSPTYYHSPPDMRSRGIYLFDRVLRI
jgi:hypothetical protein